MHCVALVSPFYPPHLGGVEVFTKNLAETLAKRGINTVVITCNTDNQDEYERVSESLAIYRIPCWLLAGGRYPLVRNGKRLRDIIARVLSEHIEGMLVNTRFFSTTPFALKLARAIGVKPVLLDHGSAYIGFGIPSIDWAVRIYEHLITAYVKHFSPHFYGVSQMSAQWLNTFGIKAEGCITNAINADAFNRLSSLRDFRGELGVCDEDMLVVFTGRLLETKGVWHVVDVARHIGDKKGVFFIIAGDGPELSALKKAVPANVSLVGRLSMPDVSALLHQADLFLFPSEYPEGMPTSVLEACACGVSTIGTNVGGMRELLPNESFGIVYDHFDSSRCAEQIMWYADNREELRFRGQNCKQRACDCFSWDHTADIVLKACVDANK